MICYEVNLWVDCTIEAAYRTWLENHVAHILTLPGFVEAHVFDILEPAPTPGQVALCVQYLLSDIDALHRYFNEFAPALRNDGLTRFGTQFSATRRVLQSAKSL